MSNEQIFSVCGTVAMLGWAVLVFAPRWRIGTRLIAPILVPLLLGAVYTSLLVADFGSTPEGGGFGTLDAVRRLFSADRALLAGWIHYLAFDLVVGGWELRDAQRRHVHHFFVIPCLAATFMVGPAGLLLYWIVRSIHQRVVSSRTGSDAAG